MSASDLADMQYDLTTLRVTPCDAAADVLTWQVVRAIVAQHQLHCLRRSKTGLAAYRAYRKQITDEYDSMGDMVMERKLGYSTDINPASGKLKAVPPSPPVARTLFDSNDFPYYMDDGIEHHVLWIEGQPVTLELVRSLLHRHRDPALYDVLSFINPPHLQSIPSVGHAHVISRLKAYTALDIKAQEAVRSAVRGESAAS